MQAISVHSGTDEAVPYRDTLFGLWVRNLDDPSSDSHAPILNHCSMAVPVLSSFSVQTDEQHQLKQAVILQFGPVSRCLVLTLTA